MNDMSPVPERQVSLSDSAVRRIASLISEEGNPSLMLRLSVSGAEGAKHQAIGGQRRHRARGLVAAPTRQPR